ncbi:cytochrome oxidase assembly protein [Leptospira inadai serovar Lyme str. 10]|uniref:Cytochrome oxidase assembly protein n=2 Tax=Leptospira inadai serovar Lyme TaxID=293084 RepID=V6HAV6_9LEPT|nr:COX15/CtaA family protein [Leptospira inadai]EQA35613.1 cytochrome oxidase assembly protein [Leptospira inadai serovar Lyme str. 10]PNV75962.1 heme A synthase [Leptospira inadai serovar Lyme]
MANSSSSQIRKFTLFLIIYSVLIFLNLLYGPLVRATDSGLACPDWPLCFGKVFPDFDFGIFMEVGHRYYSMILGFILIGGTVWTATSQELRRPFLKFFILGLLLIASQANLGRLTVTLLLDPISVNLHLLNAILFLLCIVTANLKALEIEKDGPSDEFISVKSLFKKEQIVIFIGLLLVFLQIILGGRVSSHYAGLACPEFPTCNGEWIPSVYEEKTAIQVQHRFGAYLVLLFVLVINLYGTLKDFSPKVKKYIRLSVALVLFQFLLGILNVLYKLPKLVTATHTGVAVLLLSALYAVWILRARELTKEQVS